jgi:hypothetical protein
MQTTVYLRQSLDRDQSAGLGHEAVRRTKLSTNMVRSGAPLVSSATDDDHDVLAQLI